MIATLALLSTLLNPALPARQRNEACYELRDQRSPEVARAMRKALQSEPVRACAALHLEQTAAWDQLADALADPAPEVRAEAVRALASARRASDIPAIARLAEEKNALVAVSAAQSLSRFDGSEVIPVLERIAASTSLASSIALTRLIALDPEAAARVARSLLSQPQPASRLIALAALEACGTSADLAALEGLAQDDRVLQVRQQGFGLIPPVSLGAAARRAIAGIQARSNR